MKSNFPDHKSLTKLFIVTWFIAALIGLSVMGFVIYILYKIAISL